MLVKYDGYCLWLILETEYIFSDSHFLFRILDGKLDTRRSWNFLPAGLGTSQDSMSGIPTSASPIPEQLKQEIYIKYTL
jgi:hypothetical protein